MARIGLALTLPAGHVNSLFPAAGDRSPGAMISLQPPTLDVVAEAGSTAFCGHNTIPKRVC